MTDIAAIYHDSSYANALKRLWYNAVSKKTMSRVRWARDMTVRPLVIIMNCQILPLMEKHVQPLEVFGGIRKCSGFRGDVKYYDVLERTLYNGLISGISTDGKMFLDQPAGVRWQVSV